MVNPLCINWNCHAQQLDMPMYLTEPSRTRSCSACMVSSIGQS